MGKSQTHAIILKSGHRIFFPWIMKDLGDDDDDDDVMMMMSFIMVVAHSNDDFVQTP
jgi:hypothetical protein